MTTPPIDYEALAKQNGAIGYVPAPKAANGKVDYVALAQQHGAIASQPPQPNVIQQTAARVPPTAGASMGPASKTYEQAHPQPEQSLWHRFAAAVGIPTSQAETTTAMQSLLTPQPEPGAEGLLKAEESLPVLGADFRARAALAREGHTVAAAVPFFGPASAQYAKSTIGSEQPVSPETAGAGVNVVAQTLGLKSLLKPKPPSLATGLRDIPTRSPAAEVLPKHVEALTGLIEDKAGTVDPHETASAALPHLRETAVRMKVDPSKLSEREAGQTTLKVAEQAVKDTQNEFNTIRKPYNSVLVDQKPIADAYRSAITSELLENEPKEAAALETEAKKFDKPAPLEQINQFRIRMNNRLDAFEKRGQTAQIMSDVQTKADKAAANAARDAEYSTVGRLSGLDPEYIRSLKQKEGSLIEAKSSLTKKYNRASGAQGEAASKTIREKVANVYPSPRGIKHAGIKELIGPKPIDVLNNRIKTMFSDMGGAEPLPEYEQVQPPEAPQVEGSPSGPAPTGEAERGIKPPQQRTFLRTTQADIKDYYNYRFDQLREEMKSAETPEAKADVQRRMAELDQTQRTHPVSVQPPVAGGQITPEHVAAENAFYTQARAELGADASPSAVLQRAQALKIEHAAKGASPPTTPVSPPKPTLTQKMQAQPLPRLRQVTPPTMPRAGAESASGASRQAQVTLIMLQQKQGLISPAEADSKIQRLVGSGGRRTVRMPVR